MPKTFLDGIVLGLFACVCIFLFLFFIFEFENVKKSLIIDFTNFITTIATLIVGYFGYRAIQFQITSQQDQWKKQSDNKLRAERALLPIALSEFAKVVKENANRYFTENKSKENFNHNISEISGIHINTIKRCIEADDGRAARRLAYVLTVYQILISRSEMFIRDNIENDGQYGRSWIVEDALNWISLYAVISSLFIYARTGKDDFPDRISSDELNRAIINVNMDLIDNCIYSKYTDNYLNSGKIEMNY